MADPAPSPATAYYNQRQAIAGASERLRRLREAIDDPVNLSSFQWAQWFAFVQEYRPDLVFELGRGNGNSTAVVGEALYRLGHGRLVSFCLTRTWQDRTVPRIAPMVEKEWFDRIEARVGNVLYEDLRGLVGAAQRVLLVWDAHGFEIAAFVLGHLLPILAEREHFVVMHDVCDMRYRDQAERQYADRQLWQGMEWAYRHEPRALFCLGWIGSQVDQTISVVDFLSRNGGELRSADRSIHQEIGADAERVAEMERVLSPADWSPTADWAYFSLNELPGPHTFPRYAPASAPATTYGNRAAEPKEIQATRTIDLLRIVLRRLLGGA